MDEAAVTRDWILGGAVELLQPRRGHRAGTDAVLLAQLAEVPPGSRVVDLGSASGAVGLAVAYLVPDSSLVFVERDPCLVELCRQNIGLNGLAGRAITLSADAFAAPREWRAAGLSPGSAEVVVTNPPFFDGVGRTSPDPGRRAAHVMSGGGLPEWLACAAWLLAPRGKLAMIHRADALGACLPALSPSFGSVVVTPIHPRSDVPASRVVITATRGGRSPLRLLPALVLHGPDGDFTPEGASVHRSAVSTGGSTPGAAHTGSA